ncbi:MAG: hypothetical protein ACQESP_02725 [Candidatus Muiribacteriota bacterium]
MKKIFFVFAFLIIFIIAHAEQFQMGTFEVQDVKAFIDEDSFKSKYHQQIDIDEKDKTSLFRDTKLDFDKKSELFQYRLLEDDLEYFSYISWKISDNSFNEIDLNYFEENPNYSFRGNYLYTSYNKAELNKKNKKFKILSEYDDIWGSISFTSESLYQENRINLPGPPGDSTNSYRNSENILDLWAEGYYEKIPDWSFSGRVAELEKTITAGFAAGYNDSIKNSIFEGNAYRQLDLSSNSFIDANIGLKFDSIKTDNFDKSNHRFDIEVDYTIMGDDYALVTSLGLYRANVENQTALNAEYFFYEGRREKARISLGKKYSPVNYETHYFEKDIVRVNSPQSIGGESSEFFEGGYNFNYNEASIDLTIGNEKIKNKNYYLHNNDYTDAIPDRAFQIGQKTVSRFYINAGVDYKISEGLKLNLNYNFSNFGKTVPYVPENVWSASFDYDYTQSTNMELEGLFTGKYKNRTGGIENSNYILVNFLMNHALSDNLGFTLEVENLLDEKYSLIPGYYEEDLRRSINLGLIYNF